MVLILALVLLGPKRLPQVARMLARGLREVRKASQDLKDAWESEVEGSLGDDDLRALRTLRDPGALVDDAWSAPAPVARGSTTAGTEAGMEPDGPAETGADAAHGEEGGQGARPAAGDPAASDAGDPSRHDPPSANPETEAVNASEREGGP